MLKIVASNQFKKDLKLAVKRGLQINKLKKVIDTLARQEKLDRKYQDHELSGNYRGFRDCHIEPNWLLVYRTDMEVLELYLFRTGSHADLF